MERADVACELRSATGSVEFAIATPQDDGEIRRLLRENPMRGAISISLEREPNYFDGCSLGASRDITIVARKNKRLVCVGNCSIRRRFINGKARRVGYLGGLRLDRSVEGRFDILRLGYRFFESVSREEEAELYFTSIAADNLRARQFLERDLPGMPRYEFVGEFVTFIIPTGSKQSALQFTGEREMSEEFFNEMNSRYQFATEWASGELKSIASSGSGRMIEARDQDGKTGCGVLWNQQSFKQSVVRGYSAWMKLARPLVNGFARFGNVRLPAVGSGLNMAFLSPICAGEGSVAKLVQEAVVIGAKGGIELIAVGFDRKNPLLQRVMNSFWGWRYDSRIYAVRWKSSSEAGLDERLMMPEVALL